MIKLDTLEKCDRIEIQDKVFVLKKPTFSKIFQKYRPNIEAYDKKGHKLWAVQMCKNGGYYHQMEIENGVLTAYAFSYDCIIDPENGKLIKAVFTK